MRRPHTTSNFVFQDGPQDLQPGLPGQLFHLHLHLCPHLGHWQRHPHQQLLPSDDLKLVIGLALFPLVQLEVVSARKWSRSKVVAALGLAALAIAMAAFTAWRFRECFSSKGPSASIQSVAVLPLENLSHDPEQEYFADGMTDALITDLAKIHALRVISRPR